MVKDGDDKGDKESDVPLSGLGYLSLGGHTTCCGFELGQPQRMGYRPLLSLLIDDSSHLINGSAST
jgi:hypothetical protein